MSPAIITEYYRPWQREAGALHQRGAEHEPPPVPTRQQSVDEQLKDPRLNDAERAHLKALNPETGKPNESLNVDEFLAARQRMLDARVAQWQTKLGRELSLTERAAFDAWCRQATNTSEFEQRLATDPTSVPEVKAAAAAHPAGDKYKPVDPTAPPVDAPKPLDPTKQFTADEAAKQTGTVEGIAGSTFDGQVRREAEPAKIQGEIANALPLVAGEFPPGTVEVLAPNAIGLRIGDARVAVEVRTMPAESSDIARYRFTGPETAVIEISDRVRDKHVERAVADLVAEIRAVREAKLTGKALPTENALTPGSARTELTAHDLGRIAQLKALLRQLEVARTPREGAAPNPVVVEQLDHDVKTLLDSLGLAGPDAAKRLHDVVGPQLTEGERAALDHGADREQKLPAEEAPSKADDAAKPKTEADIAEHKRLLDLATQAYEKYSGQIEGATTLLKSIIGGLGEVTGRPKDPESAANRLERSKAFTKKPIVTVEDAIDNLWDALGTRVVLSSAKPADVANVMKALTEAIKSGKLEVTKAASNHGEGVAPVLTQSDLDAINAASGGTADTVGGVKTASNSAFTSGLLFVKYPNGVRGEIQIIGKGTLEVASIEHLRYDVTIGKPLARGVTGPHAAELEAVTAPIEAAIRANDRDPAKKAAYDQYLRDLYIHARETELGHQSTPPQLPAGIDQHLSAEGLKAIYDHIEAIKKESTKPAAAKATGGGGPEGGAPVDKKAPLTLDDKLARLDELARDLASSDPVVRTRAEDERAKLAVDPEWHDALKLKGLFETAKAHQKAGPETAVLSENIPALLAEQDRARAGKDPVLQAKRESFERAIALAILKEGPIRQAIDTELGRLCAKAYDYILKTRATEQERQKAIGSLGTDVAKGYGGAVGKNQDVVLDVLKNGNIRERMLALQNFMQVIGGDALSVSGRANLEAMVASGGASADRQHYSAEDAKKLVDRVLQYELDERDSTKRDTKGLFNPNSEERSGIHEEFAAAKRQDIDTKLPPLIAEKVSKHLAKTVAADGAGLTAKGEDNPLARTTITVREAIAQGLQLSDREIQAAGGLDAQLNWVVGKRANIVNPSAPFVAEAKEASMPLKAGVSGTTYRWMEIVDLLGGDPNLARLAAIASLQAADAHSFHEIASAAQGFGIAYDIHHPYANVGLPADQLEAIAASLGTTLDELNGKRQDAKSSQ
jgi:hypothetical protein